MRYNIHRSYKSSLGRYTQADPAGIDGDSHSYLYVVGNPLSNADPSGLKVKTKNCTAAQAAKIQKAAEAAEAAAKTCLPCEDKQPFVQKMHNLLVKCLPSNYYQGANICGKAFGYSATGTYQKYQWQIDITPQAIGEASNCGCLQGTILHEVTHLIGYKDVTLSDKSAYDAQGKCFSCSPPNPLSFGDSITVKP